MLAHMAQPFLLGPDMSEQDLYQTIVKFLEGIGIPVREQRIEEDTFLPGIFLERGALVVDPDNLAYPGDLLHEAGHIAVMAPSVRAELVKDAGADQGEEIAAHAWSYAAAVACGVPPRIVFHEHGYQGSGSTMAGWYDDGHWPGVPLLAWYGLTGMPGTGHRDGDPKFPQMKAWIRTVEDPTQL